MTKRNVPSIPENQSSLILDAFARWLEGNPSRQIVLSSDGDGWLVRLDEQRTTRGRTLADAGAQAGTVINADGAE